MSAALRLRLAALVLVLAAATGSSLAMAAAMCNACCCPEAACEQAAGECQLNVADAACCEAPPPPLATATASVRLPGTEKSVLDLPGFRAEFHAAPPLRSPAMRDLCRLRSLAENRALAPLVSPLRRSVVLLI